MQALHFYYTPEMIQKLERLTQLQPSFQHPLAMLDLCAFALAQIADQVSQLPLDTPADLVDFLQGLDEAGEAINHLVQSFPHRAIEGALEAGETHKYVYRISSPYFARRVRIFERGKAPLLARISTKLASR